MNASLNLSIQSPGASYYDVEKIRQDFPILDQYIHTKKLVYLDNAATTQKPRVVVNALIQYYTQLNANIHRGIHTLAEKSTAAFEQTRLSVQAFLNAPSPEQVIFTSGTTHAINLVAASYGRNFLKAGDIILVSALEHHSNLIPWQMLARHMGAAIKVIPINEQGEIILEEYSKLLTENVKFVAVNQVSNTLGTINPVKEMIAMAHHKDIKVLIDGAQASCHLDIDVQDLDADFYAFSAHKVYGPTGVGVLYGKRDLLEVMPPYQGGGEMIKDVTYHACTYNELPYKFEAGTPNIADIIAFDAALGYVTHIGKEAIAQHEKSLLEYATGQLQTIPGLKIIGTARNKVSVISFVIKDIHHQDIGILLDQNGIAVRTGHHCTQPLMEQLNISGTARASFAMYNTMEEIDTLVGGIYKVIKMFG